MESSDNEIKTFQDICSEQEKAIVWDRLSKLYHNPRDYSIRNNEFLCQILERNSGNIQRLAKVFKEPLRIAAEKWLSTLSTLPKQTEYSEEEKSIKLIQNKREEFGTCMREIVEVEAKKLIDNEFPLFSQSDRLVLWMQLVRPTILAILKKAHCITRNIDENLMDIF